MKTQLIVKTFSLFLVTGFVLISVMSFPVKAQERPIPGEVIPESDSILNTLGFPTKSFVVLVMNEEGSFFVGDTMIFCKDSFVTESLNVESKSIPFGVKCQNVTFQAQVSFFKATFEDVVYFHEVTFQAQVSFFEATFEDVIYFHKVTFADQAFFVRANFEVLAFIAVTFESQAYFQSATFEDKVGLSKATFEGWADFRWATFEAEADFLAVTFEEEADFLEATFKEEADFSETTFEAEADFSEATFESGVSFLGATFGNKSSFYETLFADTLDLEEIEVIGKEIDLTFITDSIEHDTLKICKLFLYGADIDKIKLNYRDFRLGFYSTLTPNQRENVYTQLLNKIQKDGDTKSYQKLDIEYRKFNYDNDEELFLKWLSEWWWNFGYSKGLIFNRALLFLLVFTIFNWIFLSPLNSKVYMIKTVDESLESLQLKKIRGLKYYFHTLILSLYYTSLIFFGLRMSVENIRLKSYLAVGYVLTIYASGLICLAYMFNFVIQS